MRGFPRQHRILLVDNDFKTRSIIEQYFTARGCELIVVDSGEEALGFRGLCDLVILEWNVPGELNGLDLCKEFRKRTLTGVIMLTEKKDEIDVVTALEVGVDDYVTKPFRVGELYARAQAILRRLGQLGNSQSNQTVHGDLVVDMDKHVVMKDGTTLVLTPTEFDILSALARYPHIVFTREKLAEIAFGENCIYRKRTMDSHISNLRKKLGDDARDNKYILTVSGIGYRFISNKV